MPSGIVKWFNGQKGYGFIQPDTGGKDVFVHVSVVEKAGFSSLVEGAKVAYDLVANRGKESAENLKLSQRRWSCRRLSRLFKTKRPPTEVTLLLGSG